MLNRGGIEADRHRRPACYCTAAGVRDDLLAQFARSCGQAWTQTGDRQKQVHGMGGLAQEVGSDRSLCAAVTRRRLLMAAAPSRRSGRMAPGLDLSVSDWTCPGPRAPASTIASSRSSQSASPAAPAGPAPRRCSPRPPARRPSGASAAGCACPDKSVTAAGSAITCQHLCPGPSGCTAAGQPGSRTKTRRPARQPAGENRAMEHLSRHWLPGNPGLGKIRESPADRGRVILVVRCSAAGRRCRGTGG